MIKNKSALSALIMCEEGMRLTTVVSLPPAGRHWSHQEEGVDCVERLWNRYWPVLQRNFISACCYRALLIPSPSTPRQKKKCRGFSPQKTTLKPQGQFCLRDLENYLHNLISPNWRLAVDKWRPWNTRKEVSDLFMVSLKNGNVIFASTGLASECLEHLISIYSYKTKKTLEKNDDWKWYCITPPEVQNDYPQRIHWNQRKWVACCNYLSRWSILSGRRWKKKNLENIDQNYWLLLAACLQVSEWCLRYKGTSAILSYITGTIAYTLSL